MKAKILIVLFFFFHGMAMADTSLFYSHVHGVDGLLNLKVGQTARISVTTSEGLVKLTLKKKARKAPVGRAISGNSKVAITAPEIVHYQGRVLPKRNRRQKLLAASASLYKNRLEIYLGGNRRKQFKINLDLGQRSRRGRLSHFPGHLLLPCGVSAQSRAPLNSAAGHLPIFQAASVNSLTLELAMDADFQFYQANDSSISATLAALETIVNNVSAIYTEELGITITLSNYNIFTSSDQPYTSTNTSTLLTQFGLYLNDNRSHLNGDLRHLMTGKNTSYQGNSSVVGLAYLGVVCSSSTVNIGLSERLSPAVQHLVVAHELGHNFGADHDNSAPDSIMYPSLSPGQVSFSAISLDEINSHLQSDSACLEDGQAQGDLTLRAKLTAANKFKFVLIPTTQSIVGCSIDIYGAKSEAQLNSAPSLIASTTGTAEVGARQKLVLRRVNKTPSRNVYFRAAVSCDEDFSSNVRQVTAESGNDLRIVGPARFLSYLQNQYN